MKRAGVVLCGGKSSRMGRAKAWLPWFGRPLIEHVVATLAPAVDEVVVVTSEALPLPRLAARVVRDREEARGPLAGLRDGLEAAAADWAFVTSTDSPFLTTQHVTRLLDLERAVAPRADGHVQVLSAVYPGTAWKEADDLLRNGERRPLALLERLGFSAIDFEPAASHEPAPWTGFNTPDEYLAAARGQESGARAKVELLGRAAQAARARHHEAPIGRLGEVLDALDLPATLRLVDDGRLAKPYLVSLGGRDVVRDLDLPIGPGERVVVFDALAGG